MEAPKESLMSNGKMVIIHDLDFSESKLERSLLQIPIQMKTLVFIYIPCEVRCTMHSNTKKFGVHTLLRFLGPRSLYIRSLSHPQCSRPFYLKRETQDLCEAEVVICFQRVHVQFLPCLQSAAAWHDCMQQDNLEWWPLLSFDFLVDFLLLFNSIVAVVMGWFFHISVARALIGKNA